MASILFAMEQREVDATVVNWSNLGQLKPDWIEQNRIRVLAQVGAALGLHELVIEDIAERDQRAKVEYTDGTMHLVVFALEYEDEVRPIEVDVVLGARFVLTSHPAGWDPIASFDIARQGRADEGSLVEAIVLAARLADHE